MVTNFYTFLIRFKFYESIFGSGTVIATSPGNVNRIFDAKFRPDSDQNIVTVGIKHIKFWQICGSEIVGKKGVAKATEPNEKKPLNTMLSIAFAPVISKTETEKILTHIVHVLG